MMMTATVDWSISSLSFSLSASNNRRSRFRFCCCCCCCRRRLMMTFVDFLPGLMLLRRLLLHRSKHDTHSLTFLPPGDKNLLGDTFEPGKAIGGSLQSRLQLQRMSFFRRRGSNAMKERKKERKKVRVCFFFFAFPFFLKEGRKGNVNQQATCSLAVYKRGFSGLKRRSPVVTHMRRMTDHIHYSALKNITRGEAKKKQEEASLTNWIYI